MKAVRLLAAAALALNLTISAAVPSFAGTLVTISDEFVPGDELPAASVVFGTKISLPEYTFRIPEVFDGYLVVNQGEDSTEIHFLPAVQEEKDSLLLTIYEAKDADLTQVPSQNLLAMKESTSFIIEGEEVSEDLPLTKHMMEELRSSIKKSFVVVIGD